MSRISVLALSALFALAACGQPASNTTTPSSSTTPTTAAASGPLVGDCVDTTVAQIGSRLEGMPNSGSAISYTNDLNQVSYDAIPGIDHSQVGDAVHVCLVALPHDCPPGDDRGKIYSAVNQRTHETWTAPNSEHSCGGA